MSYQEKPPRIIELRQRVPTFEFPLESWHGTNFHLSMNPGSRSTSILRSGILPDLRFYTIMQNPDDNFPTKKPGVQSPIWLEADQRHLLSLGLVKGMGFPPAVFGGSGLAPRHVFQPEVLDRVKALRLHHFVPEGEYLATPNPEALRRGVLKFDMSKKIGDTGRSKWLMATDPNDEDYLRAIEIMFDVTQIITDTIPNSPESLFRSETTGLSFNQRVARMRAVLQENPDFAKGNRDLRHLRAIITGEYLEDEDDGEIHFGGSLPDPSTGVFS